MSSNEERAKLVKVTFTFDDGSKKSISDAQLKKWTDFNKHVCVFAQTHNQNPPWGDIRWTDED